MASAGFNGQIVLVLAVKFLFTGSSDELVCRYTDPIVKTDFRRNEYKREKFSLCSRITV